MKKNSQLQTLVSRVADRLSNRNDVAEKNSRLLVMEALEPRVLFSGSPAPAPEPAPVEAPAAQEAPAPAPAPAAQAEAAPAAAEVAAPTPTDVAAPEADVPAPDAAAADQADTAIVLTDTELSTLTEAASQIWVGSGVDAAQSAALAGAVYQVADLSAAGANVIGSAEGSIITIDDDAAGRGWFVDDTPEDGSDVASSTGIDLLSVLLHEQGHLLGLEDSSATDGDVMFQVFSEGERRLPEAGQAEGAVAGSLDGVHYATASANATLVVDGGDQAQLNGTTDPGGNNGHVWSNRPIHGQTFTTGGNAGGYDLTSVSLAGNNNSNSGAWTVRIGTLDGSNNFTAIATESATAINKNQRWITWELDTSVHLDSNTTYAFDVDTSGSGFISYNDANTDSYAGGTAFSSGGGGVPANPVSLHAWDRAFHVNLEETPFETHSFEDPDISPLTTTDEPEPTGWFDEGHPNTAGIRDESHGTFTTPYGDQAMKVWQGNQGGGQRILGAVEGDKEYTVSFNVVPRDNRAEGDYRVELVSVQGATVNVLASVEGFVTTNDMSEGDTLSLVTTAGHPDVGKELRIRLVDPEAGQVTAPWQDGPVYDNVRIWIADAPPSGDTTAPTPDPAQWDVVPATGTNYGIITMTAATASDPNGVQYFFENTTAATDSGWQDSNTWSETGLNHGATYDYRVQTRDFIGNVGGWSSSESATTLAVPGGTTVDIDSFESPDISPLTTTDNPDPDGWFATGHPNSAGIQDQSHGTFTTPFGDQALKVWQGNAEGAQRILGVVEDKAYDVSFHVSARDNRTEGDYRVELVSVDGATVNVLASVSGSVSSNDMSHTDSLSFTPGSAHADLGKELRIRMVDPPAGEVTAPWQDGPLYDYVVIKVAPVAPVVDAVDDDYTATAITEDQTLTIPDGATDILANDIGSPLTIVASDTTTNNGAAVTVNPDGSFTLDPTGSSFHQALVEGATVTDTFNYTITDGSVIPGATLSYDFANNTLNGWTVLKGVENFSGNGVSAAQSGGNFAHDAAHETFLIESPDDFTIGGATIDGTNAFRVRFDGGQGQQGGSVGAFADPTAATTFNGGNSASNGLKAVAFYNTTTGNYDATYFDPGNGGGVQTIQQTAAQLDAAGVDLSATYRLHFYENDQGGWGWTRLNTAEVAKAPIITGGTTDSAVVSVTINGVNDAPNATNDTNSITELVDDIATTNSVSGDLFRDGTDDSDIDANDNVNTFILTAISGDATGTVTGTYGTLTWTPNTAGNGSYAYELDDANAAVQALLPGETLTETFTYTMSDNVSGNPLTDTATLTITINGANDSVFAEDNNATVSDISAVAETDSGNLITDDDGLDNHLPNAPDANAFVDSDIDGPALVIASVANGGTVTDPTVDATGTYGTLDWDTDGSYTYTLNTADPDFVALADGSVVSDTFTYTLHDGFVEGDGLFNISAFAADAGGGSNDSDLNNTNETHAIWNAIDGGATVPGPVTVGSKNYNIARYETDTENRVIYDDNRDGFTGRLTWSTINGDGPGGGGGSITGGNDFSVRAEAYLAFNVGGTYSIGAGSDDGRWIELTDGTPGGSTAFTGFTARGGQQSSPPNANVTYFNGTTGHNHTTGVFTVNAGDVLKLDTFFFERGGGDEFHLSIKAGNDTTMGGTSDGWQLLTDGAFNISVDSSNNFTPDLTGVHADTATLTVAVSKSVTDQTTDIELVADGNGGFDLVIEDVDTNDATTPNGWDSTVGEADSKDDLQIRIDGTDIVVTDLGGLALGTPILGSTRVADNEVRIPLSLVTGDLIVRTGADTDTISLGAMPGWTGSITADGGDDFDFIQTNKTVVVLAEGEAIDFDAEKIQLSFSDLEVTGEGTVDLDATGGAGDFMGIQVTGTSLTSATGDITLDGKGGDTGNTNDGVHLNLGSSITTTGGSVNITGTATSTTAANDGVSLLGSSDVTVGGTGEINITGTAAGANDSYGVQLFTGTELTSAEGDITLAGTNTATGSRNSGIYTNSATVTTTGAGDISLAGEGSGSGSHSIGVRLTATTLSATGDGGVTLAGTGGGGTLYNEGVQVGVRTAITTASGDVSITGEGKGSSVGNSGVTFATFASVTSGGNVTVTGTGGAGTSFNDGVALTTASITTTGTGDIAITGTTAGTASYNRGIDGVRATIGGGAAVTLTGTGSGTGLLNDGVYLLASAVTSTTTLSMAGTSGAGSSYNRGVFVQSTTLTGGTTFDIAGTSAGTTGTGNTGVHIAYSTLSDTGTISGTGGGTGRPNYGVYMQAITTGLDPSNVTGDAVDPEDDTFGNFFPAILPLLMAESDRRAQKAAGRVRRHGNDDDEIAEGLNSLFARLRELGGSGDKDSGKTPVFRSIDGHVVLDPIFIGNGLIDDTLMTLGIDAPEVPAGTRRTILLTGEDHGSLTGFVAFADEDGELVASRPLHTGRNQSSAITVGEFLQVLEEAAADQMPSWSNRIPATARRTQVLGESPNPFADALGLL